MSKRLFTTSTACGALLLAAILVWGQGNTGKSTNMNNLPFAKVSSMLSTPAQAAKTEKMAKANGVTLMGGQPINGKAMTLTGELTGADCYLSQGLHEPSHAFCAKACVAHGSPIVFLANDGTVYVVLTPKDGVHYPEALLDDLGKPGVTVTANELESRGIKAISVQSVRG